MDFREVINRLKKVLMDEQTRREDGWDSVFDEDGHSEFQWVLNERHVLFREVSKIRNELGLDPVALKGVVYAESQAQGHSDYTSKLSIYCAELALYGEVQSRP